MTDATSILGPLAVLHPPSLSPNGSAIKTFPTGDGPRPETYQGLISSENFASFLDDGCVGTGDFPGEDEAVIRRSELSPLGCGVIVCDTSLDLGD